MSAHRHLSEESFSVFVVIIPSVDTNSLSFSFQCSCNLSGARKQNNRKFLPYIHGQLLDQSLKKFKRAIDLFLSFLENISLLVGIHNSSV